MWSLFSTDVLFICYLLRLKQTNIFIANRLKVLYDFFLHLCFYHREVIENQMWEKQEDLTVRKTLFHNKPWDFPAGSSLQQS